MSSSRFGSTLIVGRIAGRRRLPLWGTDVGEDGVVGAGEIDSSTSGTSETVGLDGEGVEDVGGKEDVEQALERDLERRDLERDERRVSRR
jgi:hypothetical protein